MTIKGLYYFENFGKSKILFRLNDRLIDYGRKNKVSLVGM